MGFLDRFRKPTPQSEPSAPPTVAGAEPRQRKVYDGPGRFAYGVVGESRHNAQLRAILTANGYALDNGGEHQTEALMLREPGNPFDPDAIAVVIDGKRVGYIPRDDAALLAPVFDGHNANGEDIYVPARIGWSDPLIIGVFLDLGTDPK